jgi:hypothetical protein
MAGWRWQCNIHCAQLGFAVLHPCYYLALFAHIRLKHSVAAAGAAAAAGPKGGRRITPAGQKDMDLIAGRVECSLPSFGL